MKLKSFIVLLASSMLFLQSNLYGQGIYQVRTSGWHIFSNPFMIDSLSIQGKRYNPPTEFLKPTPLSEELERNNPIKMLKELKAPNAKQGQVGMISYFIPITTHNFAEASLNLFGDGRYMIWFDGEQLTSKLTSPCRKVDSLRFQQMINLNLGRHYIEIKEIRLPEDSLLSLLPPQIKLQPKTETDKQYLSTDCNALLPFNLSYLMHGEQLQRIQVSPSGKYILLTYKKLDGIHSTQYAGRIISSKGKILEDNESLKSAKWYAHVDSLYKLEKDGENTVKLILFAPDGSGRKTLGEKIPNWYTFVGPKGKYLYGYKKNQGKAKDKEAIFIENIDDRTANYRESFDIYVYNIADHLSHSLTFGKKGARIVAISPDESKIIIAQAKTTWTRSPYRMQSYYLLDMATNRVTPILKDSYYIESIYFTPTPNIYLLEGSANAFNGIGKTLPADKLANDFDHQLFTYNEPTKEVTPLTKEFDPNVIGGQWDYTNNIFVFNAEKGSEVKLYALDWKSKKITEIPTKEEVIKDFNVNPNKGTIAYYGQSMMNADRAYLLSSVKTKNGGHILYDLSAIRLKGIERPVAKTWIANLPNNVKIEGWYYLPPHFDSAKKYPLLVYYYGGTSPTRRYMEWQYSPAMYASLGFVVYTLNPAGATGYGQAFAAEHINAWGDTTAHQIIESTRLFCKEHPFINEKKIGCFGASYGGFMTQYLQTQTNLFAAAVSHAGISSISNYWGSGYWGIGYNAIASAGSYPWNRPDLYVKHSPLFLANRIHTPLLLLHGDKDTNVPTAESINLYNALKVLGRPVALIEFTGQNHFILDPARRIKWTNSIMAWFVKWLQDDPRWWDKLYPQAEHQN